MDYGTVGASLVTPSYEAGREFCLSSKLIGGSASSESAEVGHRTGMGEFDPARWNLLHPGIGRQGGRKKTLSVLTSPLSPSSVALAHMHDPWPVFPWYRVERQPARCCAIGGSLPSWAGRGVGSPRRASALAGCRDGCSRSARVLATVKRGQLAPDDRTWTSEEEAAFKQPILDKYETEGSPYYSSARIWDDGVLQMLQTRDVLGLALEAARNAPVQDTHFGIFRM